MRTTIVRAFILLYLTTSIAATLAAEESGCVGPVVVALESRENQGPQTLVNGVPCTDLLDALGEILEECGRGRSVVVLASDSVTLGTVILSRGVAQKVGFSDVRMFVFTSARSRMVEVSIAGPAIPYSTDPAILGGALSEGTAIGHRERSP